MSSLNPALIGNCVAYDSSLRKNDPSARRERFLSSLEASSLQATSWA